MNNRITDWDKFRENVRRGYAESDVGSDSKTKVREYGVRLADAHAEAAVVTSQVMSSGPFDATPLIEALNMLAISPINNLLHNLPSEQADMVRDIAIRNYLFCLRPNEEDRFELASAPVEKSYGH